MTAVSLADKRKKKFSDFATEQPPLEGGKLKIDSILNQEIEITGCRFGSTRHSKNKSGQYLTLQFVINHEKHIVFTGSDVLIGQMEKYEKEIPFLATIVKINRYYTLT